MYFYKLQQNSQSTLFTFDKVTNVLFDRMSPSFTLTLPGVNKDNHLFGRQLTEGAVCRAHANRGAVAWRTQWRMYTSGV